MNYDDKALLCGKLLLGIESINESYERFLERFDEFKNHIIYSDYIDSDINMMIEYLREMLQDIESLDAALICANNNQDGETND